MFEMLERQPPDPILALVTAFEADDRPGKVDLGIGVFKDASGRTPVLASVKAAERYLAAEQTTKAYLGPEGNRAFVDLLKPLVFGERAPLPCLAGIQTPGGTGAVRLGAELVARARPGARVWLGLPSWPNYSPIFRALGLEVRTYRHFNPATQALRFDEMLTALGEARSGDVVVLQACCHNPSGVDPTLDQWALIADVVAQTNAVPFLDVAYQGLGQGLEEDIRGARLVLERSAEALVSVSCSKNFGLYRERTGALYWQSECDIVSNAALSNALAASRASYSMPPDHGAAVVAHILADAELTNRWRDEIGGMRLRIDNMRQLISREAASRGVALSLEGGRGMFAMLPLNTDDVVILREREAIYIAGNGRVNLAGLQEADVEKVVNALALLRGRHAA